MAEGAKAKTDALYGRVIAGKFQIQELLGVGAMGRVYKAHNQALDKVVAVKVLSVPEGIKDPSHAIRFKAEARAASRIDHENSVQIFDFGTDGQDNLMYIAMEFLQGQNLGDVLKRVGKLSMLRAVNVIVQVLGVLAIAHRNGVVHRDLKPANIMLVKKRGEDGGEVQDFVKVCDFGIAKVMEPGAPDDATAMTMTRAGAVFGTPAYMSPEQARGEKIDFRTDIFSCGVILYRMIAGKTPFTAETAVGLLTKLMTEEPAPLSVATSMVDPRLESIVHKAMQKDRSARFQSAIDMRNALKEMMGEPLAAPHPEARDGRDLPNVREKTMPPPVLPPVSQTPPPLAPPPILNSRLAPLPPVRATSVSSGDQPAAPFQTLTNSPSFANRTGTWSGSGTMRPPIILQESKSTKRNFIIGGSVLVAGAGAFLISRWYGARTAFSRMTEMIAAGSYSVAENIFHEHFEQMREDPRALALIPEMLAKRREVERDEERFGVKFDPTYVLQPTSWRILFTEKEAKGRTQRYTCVFEHTFENIFEGHLEWPDAGIRAAVRGIRHGNHLVFWDYAVLAGPARTYTIDDKKNAYIMGEKLIGTDGPFLASIVGTLAKD